MPDWKRLVRKHTSALTLPPCAKEQVINELSDHRIETYENARHQDLSQEASLRLALQEVGDWSVLLEGIHHAKSEDISTNRTRAFLVPRS